ncbi:MAG: hypothetical protein K5762_06155 [Bacilli bacterium]|nr:hypothetical protein [Bacilli bacterium]
MKNKNLLLLTLASLGMLASCGENSSIAPSTSSAKEETSSVVSSETNSSEEDSSNEVSSTSVTPSKLDISDVIDGFASLKVKITIEDLAIYDLYGKNSFSMEFYDEESKSYIKDGGYVEIKDKGVWSYEYDEETKKPVITSCAYAGNTENTLVDAVDFYSYIAQIGSDQYCEKWTGEDGTFTTKDEDMITVIADLAGYSEVTPYGLIPEEIKVTTTEDKAFFEGSFDYQGKKYPVSFTAENLGNNANAEVTGLISDPVLPTFTAFDKYDVDAMKTLVGEELPFCNKFTNYSYSYVDDIDGDYISDIFVFEDYKAGNIIDDYAKLLTDKNWVAGEKEIDADYGDTFLTLKKEVNAATSSKGASGYAIELQFIGVESLKARDTLLGSNLAGLNPYGIFSITGGTYQDELDLNSVTKINTFLALLDDAEGNDVIPALNFAPYCPSEIKLVDDTEQMNEQFGTTYDAYYTIDGKFSSDNDAMAAISAWLADLTAANYAYQEGYNDGTFTSAEAAWSSENCVEVMLADETFAAVGGVDIYIDLGTFNDSTFEYDKGDGSFTILITA